MHRLRIFVIYTVAHHFLSNCCGFTVPVCRKASQKSKLSSKIPLRAESEMQSSILFGKFRISAEQIFYSSPTKLTVAIVNLRPLVPGHVLVVPRRVVPRLGQLTGEEYTDLWSSVRIVQNAIEKRYKAQGSNVAVQDGRCAGQSVPHVHVHILPRLPGDFEVNDDVYVELDNWAPREEMKVVGGNQEMLKDEDRRDRSIDEMADEARLYRNLLNDSDSATS